ncbi:acyl carrier protein [Microbispora sp. RL4-1S]|uniref:Acyl carrier protein n=1 Tax=Microbispora oryzae TaxID=2806554 RepID=A0A940WCG0_9ACTN|nr:acyl carrier protein [Microbispora oryzae]MBP2702964.1 acyl carrier protein [Microbispora oryzae]
MRLSLDELKQIMRRVAGDDDTIDLADGFETRTFEDLGYDSLALMEIAHHVERACGRALPDAELEDVSTPRDLLEVVGAPGRA